MHQARRRALLGGTPQDLPTEPRDGFPLWIPTVTTPTELVPVTIGGNEVDCTGNLLASSCQA